MYIEAINFMTTLSSCIGRVTSCRISMVAKQSALCHHFAFSYCFIGSGIIPGPQLNWTIVWHKVESNGPLHEQDNQKNSFDGKGV